MPRSIAYFLLEKVQTAEHFPIVLKNEMQAKKFYWKNCCAQGETVLADGWTDSYKLYQKISHTLPSCGLNIFMNKINEERGTYMRRIFHKKKAKIRNLKVKQNIAVQQPLKSEFIPDFLVNKSSVQLINGHCETIGGSKWKWKMMPSYSKTPRIRHGENT